MADRIQFNYAITIGAQPSRDDLRQLPDEALEKAKEMAFECDQPELASFVKNDVNNHEARDSRS